MAPAARTLNPAPLHRAVSVWFTQNARVLPWREPGCGPWGVLVSEIMLQQTPVVRVLPRWHEWMDRWPTPQALAEAPTADVLKAWGSLGYPRRALRLQECARAITTQWKNLVPDDEAALRALPGIGEYTAAAVRAFAFGRRSVVLDTNVRRVFARAVDGIALPPPHLNKAERERAAGLVPVESEADAAQWAAGTMELGALVCTARAPQCQTCPLQSICAWKAAGFPEDQHKEKRRAQAWHGTDRQVRGLLMSAMRTSDVIYPESLDSLSAVELSQRERCIAGLLSDGLAVREGTGIRLPRG